MKFLSFNKLTQQSFNKAQFVNEAKHFSSQSNKSVFISYRRKDQHLVVPIVNFLRNLGADIYIDYLDDRLPGIPSIETAHKLRGRISNAGKLILIATPNSAESKWMPWELGLGDGFNGYANTIVLPLVENDQKWEEQEYYGVYGFVNRTDDRIPESLNHWRVSYPNGNVIELATWINQ